MLGLERNGQLVTVDLVKKKSIFGFMGKTAGVTIGIIGMTIGFLLCLTIVGIIVGFPMMFASLFLIWGSQGFQKVDCPTCGKKQSVTKTKENFTCLKCRQFTVINWK